MQDLTLLMVLVALVLALAAGCARSPEARNARHLDRGDRYVKAEKYRDAIIEYRNVLRIEPANAPAIRQLGLAHFALGEMGQAFRFLSRAQELEPDNWRSPTSWSASAMPPGPNASSRRRPDWPPWGPRRVSDR